MTLVPPTSRSSGPTGAAGGDLAGTYPDPTLAAIGAATGPLGTTVRTPAVTIDTKGRVTALTDQAIAFPADAVTSVFARTGAVVAATNDYTIAQIQNAAAAIGGVVWTVVTKTIDESVQSSTVLQTDDELFFAGVNLAIYEFEAFIIYASPAGAGTPDLLFAWAEDATARGQHFSFGITTGDAPTSATQSCGTGTTLTRGTAAANRVSRSFGTYVSGGGTFSFYWAQNTSDANPTIVRAGSLLRYRRIV